jgi:cytidine deaminase
VSFFPVLPIDAVAFRTHEGEVWWARPYRFSSVAAAPAAGRLLHRYVSAFMRLPVLDAVLVPETALEEVLWLASYAHKETQWYPAADCLSPTPLVELFSLVPTLRPPPFSYHLTLEARGRGKSFHGRAGMLPELPPPDVEHITPLRALLADLEETRENWLEACLTIQDDTADFFPLSGRDLQLLRRLTSDQTVIRWRDTSYPLSFFLPSPYLSGQTRDQTLSQPSPWKTVNKTELDEWFGEDGVTDHLAALLPLTLKTACNTPTPRAAVAWCTDGTITHQANGVLPQHLVPGCAETLTLQTARAKTTAPIRALMLLITGEDHQPLWDQFAAPCGFCRDHIARFCTPDARIILTDALGTFQQADARALLPVHGGQPPNDTTCADKAEDTVLSSLLPLGSPWQAQQKRMPLRMPHSLDLQPMIEALQRAQCHGSSPPFLALWCAANGTTEGQGTYLSRFMDCHSPPLLPQRFLQEKRQASAILYAAPLRDGMSSSLRKALRAVAAPQCHFFYAPLESSLGSTGVTL